MLGRPAAAGPDVAERRLVVVVYVAAGLMLDYELAEPLGNCDVVVAASELVAAARLAAVAVDSTAACAAWACPSASSGVEQHSVASDPVSPSFGHLYDRSSAA